jgi:hypothetical protein
VSTLANARDEMRRLRDQAAERDIVLRALGGLAVAAHCARANVPPLAREYPDIDFVTDRAGAPSLDDFFAAMGYAPNKTFNTLTGDWRRMYLDEARGRHIDVFVNTFEMCHKVPLADRLRVEPVTIPLAELFLTKAQIVQLNFKDVVDLYALILDHEAGDGDEETINLNVVRNLCGRDWGLYTTLSTNNRQLRQMLDQTICTLSPSEKRTIEERLATIQEAMDEAPKTLAWKLRDKLGTRVRWYAEVEEVRR